MNQLELNLDTIALKGKQKEEENFDFRAFLKGQSSNKVDKIVHRLHNEISSKIDCCECGNCCISLTTGVSEKEIKVLAEIEGITPKEYTKRYVEEDNSSQSKYLKETPCKYLDGKSCTIYEQRPSECRSYPNTHKKDFISRTFSMIENYEICPIVYNIYENLKIELGYI